MRLFSWKKKQENTKTAPKMIPVLMKNGEIEEYPEHFVISDGKNCVICNSRLYHTSLDCEHLKMEMSGGNQVKAMKIYDAQAQCFEYCYDCQKENEFYN